MVREGVKLADDLDKFKGLKFQIPTVKYDFKEIQEVWLVINRDKDLNLMDLWSKDEDGTYRRKSDNLIKRDIFLGSDFIKDLEDRFGAVLAGVKQTK